MFVLRSRNDRANLTPLMAVLVPITRVISSVTVHLMLNLKKKSLIGRRSRAYGTMQHVIWAKIIQFQNGHQVVAFKVLI